MEERNLEVLAMRLILNRSCIGVNLEILTDVKSVSRLYVKVKRKAS
jgi:hypothetical protein